MTAHSEDPAHRLEFLDHPDNGKMFTVAKWYRHVLRFQVTPGAVERYSGQRRAHFEAGKSLSCGGVFAGSQQQSADASAHPMRVYKGSADFGCIVRRIMGIS